MTDIDDAATMEAADLSDDVSIEDWIFVDTIVDESNKRQHNAESREREEWRSPQVSYRQPQGQSSEVRAPEDQDTTETTAAQYTYEPLPSCEWFRLLRLSCKRNERADIDCRLVPFMLNSSHRPSYRAVSHTWGQEPPDCTISLGNCKLKVHQNLVELLEGVRGDAHDCWLWIDAICIDQASQLEKGHQIKLMGDIYTKANSVLAWLGRDNGEIDYAFKVMSDATQRGVQKYFDSQNPKALVWGKVGVTSTVWEYEWRCIAKLLKLRYWTRRWIIQEVILASSVVLHTGQSQYAMQVIEDFFKELEQNPYDDVERKRYVDELFAGRDLKQMHAALLAQHRSNKRTKHEGPSTLYELLWLYDRFACKEPSDVIYALYNLIGTHRTHLKVDYGQAMTDRFAEILAFIQEHEPIARSDLVRTTGMLLQQLGLDSETYSRHVLEERSLGLGRIQISILDRGLIRHEPESSMTIALRRQAPALQQIPPMLLHRRKGLWENAAADEDFNLIAQRQGPEFFTLDDTMHVTSPYDMSCFATDSPVKFGLATVEICSTDQIWQFRNTNLAFVVRPRKHKPELQNEDHADEDNGSAAELSRVTNSGACAIRKCKLKKHCEIIGRALIYDVDTSWSPLSTLSVTHDRAAGSGNDQSEYSLANLWLEHRLFFELVHWAQLMK